MTKDEVMSYLAIHGAVGPLSILVIFLRGELPDVSCYFQKEKKKQKQPSDCDLEELSI